MSVPTTAEDRLVREMRRMKESAGLSYEKLAALTHYSRSSWERFLNGKKPVTRQVVEQLVTALGDEPNQLLDLWARARLEAGDTARPAADRPAVPAGTAPAPVRELLAATAFLAGVAVGALLVRAGRRGTAPHQGPLIPPDPLGRAARAAS
ncbi:helix-turn-helix domain-containing protein [Streptomyces sp. NPDC101118]|uniref:helix-turn-helix domain-containing protein n=1 Tax=Streptomyces sp. NPDC101118 TaxID=3366109 RepID=UPI00380C8196